MAELGKGGKPMSTFFVSVVSGQTISDASKVAATELGGGHAFVSTPQSFLIAEFNADGLVINETVQSQCFEVRFFSERGEVRWNLTEADTGTAVVVTLAAPVSVSAESIIETTGFIDHSYICWGQVSSVDNGWATIKSGRTTALKVPVNAEIGDVIRLETREYLAVSVEADGNTYVVDELIRGFSRER